MGVSKKINQDFFKTWNYDMAYVLGFMFADGGISENSRGACYFALHSSDEHLLINIKNKMHSDHKVSKRNVRSGNVFRFQVGSKEMVSDLKKFGFSGNKIRRMRLPEIPEKFIPDFVHGFFDGDGNVWVGETHKNNKESNITIQTSFTSGSEYFLKDLFLTLKTQGLVRGSLYGVKNKDCSRLTYSVQDSFLLYKIMYNRACSTLSLERKKKVFEKYIKMRA